MCSSKKYSSKKYSSKKYSSKKFIISLIKFYVLLHLLFFNYHKASLPFSHPHLAAS